MPRISDFMLIHKAEQHALSVRVVIAVSEMPKTLSKYYSLMQQYINKLEKAPADVPYICYHSAEPEQLDIEIIFPVDSVIPADGVIEYTHIPAHKEVSCMYLGDYAKVEPVYEDAIKWIDDNDYMFTGITTECYYNNNVATENQLTKITFLVK